MSKPTPEPSLLDATVYLATLVSDRRDVEPILDKIRRITAQVGQSFTNQQSAELRVVHDELRDYLLHQDPLRSYTPESLDESIREHFTSTGKFAKLRLSVVAIFAVGFVANGLVFGVPSQFSTDVKGQIAGFVFSFILGSGSALIFLTTLRNFRPDLRPAFRLICIAPFLIGLSQAQLMIAAVFSLGAHPLFRYGGINIPFCIAMLFVFLGLRVYARTLKVTSRSTSLVLMAGGIVATVIAVLVLPHPALGDGQRFFFDLSVAGLAPQAFIMAQSMVLVKAIYNRSTPLYRRPLLIMMAMLGVAIIGTVEYVSVVFIRGELYGPLQFVAASPFLLATILLLASGYAFKRTSLI